MKCLAQATEILQKLWFVDDINALAEEEEQEALVESWQTLHKEYV